MTTYMGVADLNGDFTVPFSSAYTSGQKVKVTAEKDAETKTIELFAPSEVVGGGVIQFSGNMNNFPINVGVITLKGDIAGVIQANALRATAQNNHIFFRATGLILKGDVTEIGDNAFKDWYYASVLELPNSLNKIGQYSFERFGSSSAIAFNCILPNSVNVLLDYCFHYAGFTGFDIGLGVATIPAYAFAYTGKLENFNYRNVTTVKGSAFYFSNLKYNLIPNTVTTIESGAYQFAKSVEVNTGNGITQITSFAFANNTLCQKFTIGLNVSSILASGLASLSACNELICLPISPPSLINASTLNGLKATCVIKVPAASLTAYQAAAFWSAYSARMVGI